VSTNRCSSELGFILESCMGMGMTILPR